MSVRRRLRLLVRRMLRVARRHYVSAISAAILAAVAGLALTSASFELADVAPETAADQDAGATALFLDQASPASSPTGAASAPPRRPLALVYLVMDEERGESVVQTHRSLVWDTHLLEEYRPQIVTYLVAGTPETESNAIRNLNYYIEESARRRFDLRIVDLRPGRGLAADAGEP
jgi:hypothetical protein